MKTGTLYYQTVELSDKYEVQLAHNASTGEYTMDVTCPTDKYSVKGKNYGNMLVLRGDKSVFNLYKVEEDIFYGEWHYQEKLGQNEVTLVKVELDEEESEE